MKAFESIAPPWRWILTVFLTVIVLVAALTWLLVVWSVLASAATELPAPQRITPKLDRSACIDRASWDAHQRRVDRLASELLGLHRIGIAESATDEMPALREASKLLRVQGWLLGISGLVCREGAR
jgi:hypothetical protein